MHIAFSNTIASDTVCGGDDSTSQPIQNQSPSTVGIGVYRAGRVCLGKDPLKDFWNAKWLFSEGSRCFSRWS